MFTCARRFRLFYARICKMYAYHANICPYGPRLWGRRRRSRTKKENRSPRPPSIIACAPGFVKYFTRRKRKAVIRFCDSIYKKNL